MNLDPVVPKRVQLTDSAAICAAVVNQRIVGLEVATNYDSGTRYLVATLENGATFYADAPTFYVDEAKAAKHAS